MFLMLLVVYAFCFVFFFKQKTAYELRISDWSSDVCSSDPAVTQLLEQDAVGPHAQRAFEQLLGANLGQALPLARIDHMDDIAMRHDQLTGVFDGKQPLLRRSEEHTSELQSLMRISYAVFCLKKKTK